MDLSKLNPIEKVKHLRNMTGVGIGDCKKALEEANYDIEEAVLVLRKRGQKISSGLKDKDTNEGSVFLYISECKKSAAIMTMCCQTDFVAKTDDFCFLGKSIIEVAVQKKVSSKRDLLVQTFDSGETIESSITNVSGKIKENITIKDFGFLSGRAIYGYLHHNNQVGAIVSIDGGSVAERDDLGFKMALHITANAPVVINKEDLNEEIINQEIQIAKEKAASTGKSEEVVQKIAEGMAAKSLEDVVLTSQKFEIDPSLKVKDVLNKKNLEVKAFFRYSIK